MSQNGVYVLVVIEIKGIVDCFVNLNFFNVYMYYVINKDQAHFTEAFLLGVFQYTCQLHPGN